MLSASVPEAMSVFRPVSSVRMAQRVPEGMAMAKTSVAVTADAAIKIATAREEFASTDTFLEMIGFDQADIRRIRAQEQRVRGQQVLMEMEDEDNDAGVGDVHPQAGEAE